MAQVHTHEIPFAELVLGNEIGRGSYGPVYSGQWNGRQVAVKMRDERFRGAELDEAESFFRRETSLLGQISHPRLISLLCSVGSHGCLVFPLMIGGDLRAALDNHGQPLTAAERLRVAADVASGLALLHSPHGQFGQIFHRDLTSRNILLDEQRQAKIADFGLARPQMRRSFGHGTIGAVGTDGYIDPEYMFTGILTPASDVFSFGVVLLELLTGSAALARDLTQESRYLHFRARGLLEDAQAVAQMVDPRAEWGQIEAGRLAAIARSCIAREGTDRMTIEEVSSLTRSAAMRKLTLLPKQAKTSLIRLFTTNWECIVCMQAARSTRLLPCRHVIMCTACTAGLEQRRCPYCMTPFVEFEEGEFYDTYSMEPYLRMPAYGTPRRRLRRRLARGTCVKLREGQPVPSRRYIVSNPTPSSMGCAVGGPWRLPD